MKGEKEEMQKRLFIYLKNSVFISYNRQNEQNDKS